MHPIHVFFAHAFCRGAPHMISATEPWLRYLLGQPWFSKIFSLGPHEARYRRVRPVFLGRIACPTATTTAATSLSLASKHIAQAHGEHTSNGAWQPREPGLQFSALDD